MNTNCRQQTHSFIQQDWLRFDLTWCNAMLRSTCICELQDQDLAHESMSVQWDEGCCKNNNKRGFLFQSFFVLVTWKWISRAFPKTCLLLKDSHAKHICVLSPSQFGWHPATILHWLYHNPSHLPTRCEHAGPKFPWFAFVTLFLSLIECSSLYSMASPCIVNNNTHCPDCPRCCNQKRKGPNCTNYACSSRTLSGANLHL